MTTIYLQLDPRNLQNPDADLRHLLPELISEASCGEVTGDGYDYVGDVPYLLLFLKADDEKNGLAWVVSVLEHERGSGNELLGASVVAVERDGRAIIEYPRSRLGDFLLTTDH